MIALLLTACASIGRPMGGPRDTTPPEFVQSTPMPGATNVKSTRFDIFFNENVQLDDPSNKVIVSPAQKLAPSINAQGRRVTVELRDSLVPNTTYTIDFADAVNDLNERNVLDGFALDFSTGDTIDTLRISGMVLAARNLEPAQGMLVGVYSNLSDTALTTLPFERVARTNQLGQFTIRNLKAGNYRIFAVNDVNRDNHWDRSEDVAFYDVIISPTVEAISVTDTLRSATNLDSLVERDGVRFLPNDVFLQWFNEEYKAQYLADYSRPERNKIFMTFGAKSDTLPELTILDGPLMGRKLDRHAILKRSVGRDSLEYWITDSAIIARDSLLIAARYLRTDTLDQLSWTTDTLKFNFKAPKSSKKKKNKDSEADSVPQITFLDFTASGSSTHDIGRPLYFTAGEPVSRFDSSAVHLQMLVDTLWTEIKNPPGFTADSLNPMLFRYEYNWQPATQYRLTVDSAAITSVYGHWNSPIEREIKVKKEEDYGNLYFRIEGVDSCAFVELLAASDAVVATAPVEDGLASFKLIKPSTYFARLVLDPNNNGKWDTGSIAEARQPEDVFYYPRKINLKANWDIEQGWNIYDTAVDLQKPAEIKKNKPKTKSGQPGRKNSYDEDEDEYEDDFMTNGYQGTTTNRYDNEQRTLRGNSNSLRQF